MQSILDLLSFLGPNFLLGTIGALVSMALISGIKNLIDRLQTLTFKVGAIEITVKPDNINETLREIDEKVRELQEHPRVFLSFSNKDREFAHRLAKDLRAEGIEVWTAEEQLKAGDMLTKQIEEAISSSQWVIVILSPNSAGSNFVNRELDLALKAEKERDHTFIIPVAYKGDQIPSQLEDRVFADFRTNYEASLNFLISSIKRTENIKVELGRE